MPRYLIIQRLDVNEVSELEDLGRHLVAVTSALEGTEWICSHIARDPARWFCILEAPGPEACQTFIERAGLSVDEVVPLDMVIGPCLFT